MDVFDLSSQEEFSPFKPLTKRARKVFDKPSDVAVYPGNKNTDTGTLTKTSENLHDSPAGVGNSKNLSGGNNTYSCIDELGVEVNSEIKDYKLKAERDCGKPVYIYSQELIQCCYAMPKIINRASMVHSLIEAYGLLQFMQVTPPRRALDQEMSGFHAKDYIDFLALLSKQNDEEKYEEESEQYGLTYDCPINRHVYTYASLTSGASLRAAECLLEGRSQVAVNWCGGWHHAKRHTASGFCYVNDIVLAILKLREKFERVLYLDLDVHHGDGVEEAFCASSKVMTVSVHKHSPGFFPGSGGLSHTGVGKGKGYTVNIPLLDGMRDEEFVPLVCRVLHKVHEVYRPQAVVCQCGADGLSGDPMDSFNLTHTAYGRCLQFLLQWKLPTLVLGGGGYHNANTARCWAHLTAVTCGRKIPPEIPDHKYFMAYGPDYELLISPGNRRNMNSKESLQKIYSCVIENLKQLKGS
ncbi:histone deacetylase 8-like [Saccostrea echinata]|uniref:histone deacetylase 8-like n=1 Tax=Saccostrea echinata TaxID=191078 RepID=UPI002A829AEA|nr:histone deacetylase 8-like [Saccostrea echinata]XP_061177574.1 histone deacetylase 8-like [Saccostrea echinata]XP_061177575.1 histone deacetylase 8-like [Saccostrea echinata]